MNNNASKGICAFSEIAHIYYPNITKAAASRKLRRKLEQYPSLMKQLQELGYSKNTKELTPALKNLIFNYLGRD